LLTGGVPTVTLKKIDGRRTFEKEGLSFRAKLDRKLIAMHLVV